MPKGGNKMDTKSDEQFLVIEAIIEANKQDYDKNQVKNYKNRVKNDEKLIILTENLQKLTTLVMDQTNISKSSTAQKDTSTPPDPKTVVQTNRRSPPLEGGHSTNIGCMWTLKHEIISPKFYEILIKT